MRSGTALAIVMFLLVACAQVRDITGGEKDTIPPTLVSATPPNGSIRFSGRTIRLEFDERIQLERVRERLLISPPLEEAPVVRIVGSRSVELTLKSELKENTTYSFNLGESIKDLSEGNLAAGLNYVVSTGDILDSLRISGMVMNAFTGTPEKNMLLILQHEGDTAAFRTGSPLFMARSSATGSFELGHLPAGRYALFAIGDKNGNFRYDLPNEEIGFLDSAVILPRSDTVPPSYLLRSFLPASPFQQVRTYSVLPDGALQVVLTLPGDTFLIRDVARTGGSLTWVPEWNQRRDTVLLWPSDTTLVAAGSYELVQDGVVLDTLRYRPTRPMPFNTTVTAMLIEREGEALVRLRASRPISRIDSTRLQLVQDSVQLPLSTASRGPDTRTIELRTTLQPGSSAQLRILPKAVRDIYGGSNDTLQIPLGRAAEDATGTLRVNINGVDSNASYLLQLLDGQQRVVREAAFSGNSPHVLWTRLAPGKCTVRLIADTNANGLWDTGEWRSLEQPENTWYHPEPVNVRAAWDVVLDWALE